MISRLQTFNAFSNLDNYAGTLIIWDRMFGTFVPERVDDRPRYGLTTQLGTFHVLRVAFHELIGMARDVSLPGLTATQRLGYLFRPPGWSHDGSRQTAAARKRAYVTRNPDQAGQPGLPVSGA